MTQRCFALLFFAVTVFSLLPVMVFAQEPRGRVAPEGATGFQSKTLVTAEKFMIVAANPYAAEAGKKILQAGGSAVDAAIATQLVLGLVEPQSSGIGGGAFMLHWNAGEKNLTTYDGRETAPMAAKADRFMQDGERKPYRRVVRSGLSVGVPGLIKMLALAHKEHGKLPWVELFAPAIALAEAGFRVSPRLNGLLRYFGEVHFTPKARQYFFDENGAPISVGTLRRNLPYAKTLRVIAEKGPEAFYQGAIAEQMVEAVKSAPNFAGDMTLADISGYQAKVRAPICFVYRKKYKICGMGPPSSGAITIAQSLLIADMARDNANISVGASRIDEMHFIAEAQKLAYADRKQYIADKDFVPLPSGILDEGYLRTRARLIDVKKVNRKPLAGLPPGIAKKTFGRDATRERSGTSHISIVDAEGNAVSMTSSIEGAFGSGLWAGGFLLNNELTDFSFRPTDKSGVPIANRVEGGKRPRSSMSPTMVFNAETGELEFVLGSPGGTRIILYVAKALVAMLNWGLDPQAAASFANFGARRTDLEFESRNENDASSKRAIEVLTARGHKIRQDRMTSGLHIIQKRQNKLYGGADPRREGVALGE